MTDYFKNSISNGPREHIEIPTLADLKKIIDGFEALYASVDLIPNPCDVGPKTYEALKASCRACDIRAALSIGSVTVHRSDLVPDDGNAHPCNCTPHKVTFPKVPVPPVKGY
jgi:hypothetical protein